MTQTLTLAGIITNTPNAVFLDSHLAYATVELHTASESTKAYATGPMASVVSGWFHEGDDVTITGTHCPTTGAFEISSICETPSYTPAIGRCDGKHLDRDVTCNCSILLSGDMATYWKSRGINGREHFRVIRTDTGSRIATA